MRNYHFTVTGFDTERTPFKKQIAMPAKNRDVAEKETKRKFSWLSMLEVTLVGDPRKRALAAVKKSDREYLTRNSEARPLEQVRVRVVTEWGRRNLIGAVTRANA